jgi:cell wall assembly regulator SMI1
MEEVIGPKDVIPPGASEADLDDFVTSTGISLPDDLRTWLRLTNGVYFTHTIFAGIRPFPPRLDLEADLRDRPHWKQKAWIPVATDGSGSTYLMASRQEFGEGYPLFLIEGTQRDQESPLCIVSSDMEHFLMCSLEKELAGLSGWPFNKDYMIERDPEIMQFPGLRLPWTLED